MIKVIMDFDGSEEDFERAFDSMDENFNINDSVFWLIDYGVERNKISGSCIHHTEYGDIKITVDKGLV